MKNNSDSWLLIILLVVFTLPISRVRAQTADPLPPLYVEPIPQDDKAKKLPLNIYFEAKDAAFNAQIETVDTITLTVNNQNFPATIEPLSQTETPYHLALLLDVSNSTNAPLPAMQAQATDFVATLPETESARLAVWGFEEAIQWAHSFDADHEEVIKAIHQIPHTAEATCLYDTTVIALDALQQQRAKNLPRQGLVLFTDGIDQKQDPLQVCSQHTLTQTIAYANQLDIPVYVVLFAGENGRDAATMCALTSETGGTLTLYNPPGDLDRLRPSPAPPSPVQPEEVACDPVALDTIHDHFQERLSQQWLVQAQVYTPQGFQTGTLTLTLATGEPLPPLQISFTSPRAFPRPPNLQLAETSKDKCDGDIMMPANGTLDVAFKINDPDHLVDHAALVVSRTRSESPLPGPLTMLENESDIQISKTLTISLVPSRLGAVSGEVNEYDLTLTLLDESHLPGVGPNHETVRESCQFSYRPPPPLAIKITGSQWVRLVPVGSNHFSLFSVLSPQVATIQKSENLSHTASISDTNHVSQVFTELIPDPIGLLLRLESDNIDEYTSGRLVGFESYVQQEAGFWNKETLLNRYRCALSPRLVEKTVGAKEDSGNNTSSQIDGNTPGKTGEEASMPEDPPCLFVRSAPGTDETMPLLFSMPIVLTDKITSSADIILFVPHNTEGKTYLVTVKPIVDAGGENLDIRPSAAYRGQGPVDALAERINSSWRQFTSTNRLSIIGFVIILLILPLLGWVLWQGRARPEAVLPAEAAAATTAVRLRVETSGDSSMIGEEWHLVGKDMLIGRHATCDLPLINDGRISGQHAQIRFENEQYHIVDLDSTNKTFVNQKQLEPFQPEPINTQIPTDISLGDSTLLRIEEVLVE